jgi:hypothetical protein
MSDKQLELKLDFEQSEEAKLIKESILDGERTLQAAEKIHRLTMETLRERLHNLRQEFKKKCSHPKTKIRDDFNYHKNEEWKEEVCEECGAILRRW